ncbi:MAG TPA: RIP metalloprotease RseP [Gemmatimonadales bacterium]|nr:RIP metalloprotease RseP [Gemmatimonadales bacterium]
MLLTLAAVAVVLGVLIFVHEMGHFIAAKAVGIQVLRFSLGFGKPVARWRRGETEYWISWLPLGGYVKMAGLEDEGIGGTLEGGKSDTPVDPARAFDRQPVWKRTIVILAGVTMNVVLAIAIYSGAAATYGTPRVALTPIDSVVTAELPAGARALASLEHGARIIRVNGDTVRDWVAVRQAIRGGPSELRLELAGRDRPLVVTLPADTVARQRIADALVPLFPARIGLLLPGYPALRAGLRPGDVLVRLNGDTVTSWNAMVRVVRQSPGRPLTLGVLRRGTLVDVTVVPLAKDTTDPPGSRPRRVGVMGAEADVPLVFVREPLTRALGLGFRETGQRVVVVLGLLKGLVVGDVPLREVGGPILIGQLSGQVARLGVFKFLEFLAFFSVNLAILNLLPIPILDGGQFVFLLAEAVRRKPLSLELRTRLTQIGFVVLLGIMLLALTNDALRVLPR